MLELAIAMVICAFILGCMGFFGLAAGTAAITSRENRCLAIPLIAAAAELMYRSCSYMLLLTLLPTAVMFSMTNRLVQQVGGWLTLAVVVLWTLPYWVNPGGYDAAAALVLGSFVIWEVSFTYVVTILLFAGSLNSKPSVQWKYGLIFLALSPVYVGYVYLMERGMYIWGH